MENFITEPKGKNNFHRHVAVDLTTRCNLNCSYCFCYRVSKKNELTFDEIIQVMSDLHEMGVGAVAFSGGEPTLREDFMELVQEIGKGGMKFSLQTNGCFLTKDDIKRISPHLERAGVSVDGPPRIHNEMRGEFDKALQTIEHLVDCGIPTTINTSVTAFNWDHLDYIVDLALEKKVDGLKMHPVLRMDRNRTIDQRYFFTQENYSMFFRWLITQTLKTMGHCRLVTSLKSRKRILEHPCEVFACWGDDCHEHNAVPPPGIIIQADGDIMPSEVIPKKFRMGTIRDAPISEIVETYFGSTRHKMYLHLVQYCFQKHIKTSDQSIIDWKQHIADESRRTDFQNYCPVPIKGDPSCTPQRVDLQSVKPMLNPGITFNEHDQTVILSGTNSIPVNEVTELVLLQCTGENSFTDILHILNEHHASGISIKKSRIEDVLKFLFRMNIITGGG
jgi:MoaA/NifB/PqqE/SkfB family radical SAM enzyme